MIIQEQNTQNQNPMLIDPPSPGQIDGHHFKRSVRSSVLKTNCTVQHQNLKKTFFRLKKAKKETLYNTTWVTITSQDLLILNFTSDSFRG